MNIREKVYTIIKDAEIPYEGVDISTATDGCCELIEQLFEEKDKTISELQLELDKLKKLL